MPPQAQSTKPTRQGHARHACKQTKLLIACQKAFRASKQPISGVKSGCSPIETGVTSYQIDSDNITYNERGQVSSITRPDRSISYDLNGNLINDASISHRWDGRNQLASLSGGAVASFQYDGVGRRISKTVTGTATAFLYDGLNPVQELTGSAPQANLLTDGLDETSAAPTVPGPDTC